MISVQRTISISRPITEAAAYLEDFTNTEHWDPATVSCRRLDHGPIRPGSSWTCVSLFRGRTTTLAYQLSVRDAAHLVFVGENRTVQASDDLTLRAISETETELVYRAQFRFKGLTRLAAPFLRRDLERLADDVEHTLPRLLET
ncbi:SRPBCC family protein [Streptomyces sp. R44]|uniref:SRPBCC family protein n=1 Tax=Streptomyces sp. R44 TaxID=3238633 RepID=A0AB39SP36_9ACTN